MAKKQIAAPVVETPAAETTVTTTTTPAAKPCFWRDDQRAFTPRRGFETALYAALGEDMLTVDQAVARLRDSGEYARVAPQALALRPAKPVAFLFKTWAATGILRRSL